ncbi:MAG: DEAD/DEAH box helicase [Eubacteriales bacterium]
MKQTDFKELGLSPEVYSAIEKMDYTEPTQIQAQTIPLILEGRDVIGQSQTGTGKTMAFGLPAVDIASANNKAVQVLVLCPTRELALQAANELSKAAAFKRGLNVVAVFGGAPIGPQIKALKRGAQIVIGTPGRVMDHMRRRTLKLGALKLAILDEADEMLNMGFRNDMEAILGDTPENRVTVLFSATMSNEIKRLTKRFQKDAVFIKSAQTSLTVNAIDQWHTSVDKSKKTEAIMRLLTVYRPQMALVFCNTKRMVDNLTERLKKHNISVAALHGDMDQHVRNRVMKNYREGNFSVLVATDVAARGIDVDGIEMVINYDVPKDTEYYVHRIGRTGRAGRSGKAVTLLSGQEGMREIRQLERFIKTKIPFKKMPTAAEADMEKNRQLADEIKLAMDKQPSKKNVALVTSLMSEGCDAKDIAIALLQMLNENVTSEEKVASKKSYGNTGAQSGMVRFFINMGKMDRIAAGDIVGCIAGETKVKGSEIGKIDVFDKFSFVEVPEYHAPAVQETMRGVMMKGREMNFEPAAGRK